MTETTNSIEIVAPNPRLKVTASTGTNPSYLNINNTGGSTYVGMESSVAGSEFTGTTAYASIFGSSAAKDTQFLTGTTVKMTVASGGNVGIGTTTPDVALDVEGASNLASRMRLTKTTGKTLEMGADRDTTAAPYIGTLH